MARIDAIAKASGYNSSLILHYFGDKLGLYARAVKRADKEMTGYACSHPCLRMKPMPPTRERWRHYSK
jgi:AcrR family transcriptional regulator